MRYPVECIDHTRDLDKRLVAESYVNQKAGDIIKHIIAKYTVTSVIYTSPTGHNDYGEWFDETKSYDDDDATYAYCHITGVGWSGFLELTINALSCNKVRWKALYAADTIDMIDLDVYYDGSWHDVYEGSYSIWTVWNEKSLGGIYSVTKAKVRFHNCHELQRNPHLYEFDFGYAFTPFTTTNVSNGPTISEIAFDYVQVSDAITKIAEICGYEWYVDYDKDVYFFFRTDYPAPFQLDDDQANYKDLIISTDISQIRNRVYVKSSAIKDTFGEVFIGDGATTSWTCKFTPFGREREMLPYPKPSPWNGVWNTAFSHDDIYLAMAYERVGGIGKGVYIYKRDDDLFERINYPNTTPDNDGHDVSFSSDSVYLALAHVGTPYVMVYKRDEDTFTKLANPDTLPTGDGWGCDFSPDGVYLAIAHEVSPFITIYKRDGDTFTKLTNPINLPTGVAYGCKFSPDGVYLAVAHTTSPYVTIYKRSGDTFTKLTNPTNLPTGESHGVAWTPDSIYLAVAHDTTPFITVYKREGDVFTKLTNPATLPTGNCWRIDFSSDGIHLAVAHSNTPYVTIYTRSGDILGKQNDPTDLPDGHAFGCRFSHDDRYLVVGYFDSRNIIIYKQFFPTMKVDGEIKTIGWDGIDNPDYYDFMLNGTTKVLSLGTYTSTPATDVELLIGYTVTRISICFRRDDKDSITDRQTKEGGDGIFEFCIVDNNINSIDWANEAAKADLLQNAEPVIKATFITNRNDIRGGQLITLDSVKRGIVPPQQFIVQKVELVRVDVIEYYGTAEIPYKPADEAVIGYKPADEAEVPYKPADSGGEIIYYIFNVTIANKFKKLEDLFIYLLNRADESLK